VSADQISRQPDGTIIFRNGYFYRHGNTSDRFQQNVTDALTRAGITHTVIDSGDKWTPFNGGATLARSSHFWVRVILK
jgi:hypothetical protein